MIRTVTVGDTDAERLKVYFDLQDLDGNPATGQAGGQPEISINGLGFNGTGISVLIAVGHGLYYATLSTGILTNEGDIIHTRYQAAGVKAASGDTFQVVNATTYYGDPTAGLISNVSYLTVDEADGIANNRLNVGTWNITSADDKRKALIQATSMIDRLNFAGEITLSYQRLQFPRRNLTYTSDTEYTETKDTVVPAEIKTAAFLVAIKLLEGVDIDMEAENLTKTGTRFHQVQTTYDRSFVPEHLAAGIPSAEAWRLIKPYLADPRSMTLLRV